MNTPKRTRCSLILALLLAGVTPDLLAQSSAGPEQAVVKLEQERVEAMVKGDLATLERVLADDFVYTHSNARVETRPQLLEALRSGVMKYDGMTHSEVTAQAYGETVLLRGLSDLKIKANGAPLSFRVRFLAVYARLKGRWQMVAWQSTRVPQ